MKRFAVVIGKDSIFAGGKFTGTIVQLWPTGFRLELCPNALSAEDLLRAELSGIPKAELNHGRLQERATPPEDNRKAVEQWTDKEVYLLDGLLFYLTPHETSAEQIYD